MRQTLPHDVKIVATTISQRVPLGYSAHTFHVRNPLTFAMVKELTELCEI